MAALALLFAALAPALAHALPSRDGRVEVCTAQGSKWVAAADAAASDEAPALAHDHCATCGSQELPAMPVPDAPAPEARPSADAAPAAVEPAPPSMRRGGFAQPRAPPAWS